MKQFKVGDLKIPPPLPEGTANKFDIYDHANYRRLANRILSWNTDEAKTIIHPSPGKEGIWLFRTRVRGEDIEHVAEISEQMFNSLERIFRQSSLLSEIKGYFAQAEPD